MPLPTVFDSCGDFSACRERTPRRHGLRIACGCVPRRERSLRRSSSPKKVTPRLCCLLVNALATRRLATNFFRCQAVRCCAFSLVGGKLGRMPFGRSTVKHEIGEYTLKHAAPVRRRAFRYNHVYILAVGAGAPTLRFRRSGVVPFLL